MCTMSPAMTSSLILLFALAYSTPGFVISNYPEICPDGWTIFHGSCYYISDNISVDWIEATHHCALHQAHLVIIDSKEEDLFIRNELDRMYRTSDQRPGQEFWIGTSDEVVEGVWVWYKGDQPLGYTHWYPGQPGSDGMDEDCAVIASRNGEFNGWHDAPCAALHHPLCEIGEMETTEIVG